MEPSGHHRGIEKPRFAAAVGRWQAGSPLREVMSRTTQVGDGGKYVSEPSDDQEQSVAVTNPKLGDVH